VTFDVNSSSYGGGLYNSNSNPTLKDVTFHGNSAGEGGGMENSDSSPTLTNATFSDNLARPLRRRDGQLLEQQPDHSQ